MKSSIIILTSLIFLLQDTNVIGQAELSIEFYDIRSTEGQILMSVFNEPSQFPRKALPEFKDIRIPKDKVKENTLSYNLKNLKPGKYAIAILDDENSSGDMEFTKLGIPKEGYGFSNDAKPLLSAPPYKKCLFEVKEGKNKIRIKVRYR